MNRSIHLHKKKTVYLFAAVGLLLSLSGCSGKPKGTPIAERVRDGEGNELVVIRDIKALKKSTDTVDLSDWCEKLEIVRLDNRPEALFTRGSVIFSENYIGLLEKCFVVFRLESFSRNMRNEIKRGKKIYFYDNGVRNAVISNFAPLELRTDTGALWENLMVSERVKRNSYAGSYAQLYFWRTHDQKEIDLIEEQDGILSTFEIKYNPKTKAKPPKAFVENYPNSTWQVVTPDNFWEFVK